MIPIKPVIARTGRIKPRTRPLIEGVPPLRTGFLSRNSVGTGFCSTLACQDRFQTFRIYLGQPTVPHESFRLIFRTPVCTPLFSGASQNDRRDKVQNIPPREREVCGAESQTYSAKACEEDSHNDPVTTGSKNHPEIYFWRRHSENRPRRKKGSRHSGTNRSIRGSAWIRPEAARTVLRTWRISVGGSA